MNEFYSINTGMISSPEQVLCIFGHEFEKYGGLRALALDEIRSKKMPYHYPDQVVNAYELALGSELASQGAADSDEVYGIFDACFMLRERFKEGWIKKSLQAYLVHVKKWAPELAEVECKRLIEAAEARYAEALEAQRAVKQAQRLELLKRQAEECETELADLRQQIEALSAAA